MSRLFVSEYKNNVKLSESKKDLSSKMPPRSYFLFFSMPRTWQRF